MPTRRLTTVERAAMDRYLTLEPRNTPAEAAASQPVDLNSADTRTVAYLLGRGNREFSAPNYAIQGSQPQSENRLDNTLWIDEAAGLGIHHSPFEQHEPPANHDLLDERFPPSVDWSQYPMSVRRVTLHVLGNHLEGISTRSYERPTPDVGGDAACQSNQ